MQASRLTSPFQILKKKKKKTEKPFHCRLDKIQGKNKTSEISSLQAWLFGIVLKFALYAASIPQGIQTHFYPHRLLINKSRKGHLSQVMG